MKNRTLDQLLNETPEEIKGIVKKSTPWMNNFSMVWWDLLLAYPLSNAKKKLTLTGTNRVVTGILTDHLMSIARNLNVPQVYIKAVHNSRKKHVRVVKQFNEIKNQYNAVTKLDFNTQTYNIQKMGQMEVLFKERNEETKALFDAVKEIFYTQNNH